MTEVEKFYPLGFVDDVLENVGLPKTKTLLEKVAPKNILGNKLGITSPGDVLEGVVEDIDSSAHGGKLPLPALPGMR